MLQKLISQREFVEKQSMYLGVALALILLLIPFVTRVSWSATLPSVVLSISLTGFMLIRRKSRR
ncbi:hypothetical protein D3C81_2108990 [compost metagenome]